MCAYIIYVCVCVLECMHIYIIYGYISYMHIQIAEINGV